MGECWTYVQSGWILLTAFLNPTPIKQNASVFHTPTPTQRIGRSSSDRLCFPKSLYFVQGKDQNKRHLRKLKMPKDHCVFLSPPEADSLARWGAGLIFRQNSLSLVLSGSRAGNQKWSFRFREVGGAGAPVLPASSPFLP